MLRSQLTESQKQQKMPRIIMWCIAVAVIAAIESNLGGESFTTLAAVTVTTGIMAALYRI